MMSPRAQINIYDRNQLRALGSKDPYELVESVDVDNETINKYPWAQPFACLKFNTKYYACKLCCDGSGCKK